MADEDNARWTDDNAEHKDKGREASTEEVDYGFEHTDADVEDLGLRKAGHDDDLADAMSTARTDNKLFVGGLSQSTTQDKLRQYFSKHGEVLHVKIMTDPVTHKSRGYAFITFKDPRTVEEILDSVVVEGKTYELDGKTIDPKRAHGTKNQTVEKVFVGGVPDSMTQESFEQYFKKYGEIRTANLMIDKTTGKPRGFGFVQYASADAVQKALDAGSIGAVVLDGKTVEVKKATPRGQTQSRNDPNPYPGMDMAMTFQMQQMMAARMMMGMPMPYAGSSGAPPMPMNPAAFMGMLGGIPYTNTRENRRQRGDYNDFTAQMAAMQAYYRQMGMYDDDGSSSRRTNNNRGAMYQNRNMYQYHPYSR
ncbi:hypothetical protein BZG36_04362 [Bifiguratus adelaidae]|uniref:RRM domain-containing protein n=1 Tax=Bifiguratus adelaidae TaxID=1938954 RepID=A0A261XW68_9FUNG|nr:hypothetical protein BZG36_04362 [Bifiguratus adelaidae]